MPGFPTVNWPQHHPQCTLALLFSMEAGNTAEEKDYSFWFCKSRPWTLTLSAESVIIKDLKQMQMRMRAVCPLSWTSLMMDCTCPFRFWPSQVSGWHGQSGLWHPLRCPMMELHASQPGVQLTGIYSPRVWESTLRQDVLAAPPGNKWFSVYKTLILKET